MENFLKNRRFSSQILIFSMKKWYFSNFLGAFGASKMPRGGFGAPKKALQVFEAPFGRGPTPTTYLIKMYPKILSNSNFGAECLVLRAKYFAPSTPYLMGDTLKVKKYLMGTTLLYFPP